MQVQNLPQVFSCFKPGDYRNGPTESFPINDDMRLFASCDMTALDSHWVQCAVKLLLQQLFDHLWRDFQVCEVQAGCVSVYVDRNSSCLQMLLLLYCYLVLQSTIMVRLQVTVAFVSVHNPNNRHRGAVAACIMPDGLRRCSRSGY